MNPFEKYLSAEDKLQRATVQYALMQYKVAPIPCNTESRKTEFERFKSVQMGVKTGTLDLFFPYPKKGYHGLFIELKKDGEKLYRKDGKTLKTEHLDRQQSTIDKHNSNGYYACFCVGFDQVKRILDFYFK